MRYSIQHHVTFLLICIAIFIFSGCRVESPVKEMTDARIAIAKAESFGAAQYAAEDLNKARELLLASHSSTSQEEYSTAKKQALEALEYAQTAIEKSRKPALEKLITQLETDLKNSSSLLPDKHAVFLHAEIKDRVTSARNALASDQLDLAENTLQEGTQLLAALKEQCLGNKPGYIASVKLMLDNLEKMEKAEGASFATNDIDSAKINCTTALSSLENNDISTALQNLEKADAAFSTARLKILKGLAAQRLAKATSLHSSLDSSLAASHKADVEKAEGFIGEGKALYEEFYYALVITKASSAIEILEKIAGEKSSYGARVHIVRYIPGNTDTLVNLAYKYYGAWSMWPVIFQANRDQIKDPDIIYPGQKLVIPEIKK